MVELPPAEVDGVAKSNFDTSCVDPPARSRTNKSVLLSKSPETRSLASLPNETTPPSALIPRYALTPAELALELSLHRLPLAVPAAFTLTKLIVPVTKFVAK